MAGVGDKVRVYYKLPDGDLDYIRGKIVSTTFTETSSPGENNTVTVKYSGWFLLVYKFVWKSTSPPHRRSPCHYIHKAFNRGNRSYIPWCTFEDPQRWEVQVEE